MPFGGANQFDPTQSVYSGKGNTRYGGYWERLDATNKLTGLTFFSQRIPVGVFAAKNDIGQSQ